jgi:threonine aldolase
MGAMAALSGLVPRPVEGEGGLLAPAAVAAAVRPAADYLSRSMVLVVENTHNMAGGVVCRPDRLRALLEVAAAHRLAAHLDGARLPNAAVVLGVSPATLAAGFATVMVSLSRGLGCPVGSVLCGDGAVIEEARRVRRLLGGGMRQAGILAAAGLLALRRGFDHLAEDHANARRLAMALAELPDVEVDAQRVETNIVVARVGRGGQEVDRTAAGFLAAAREAGVLGIQVGPDRVRFVTHRDVPRPLIDEAISRLRRRFQPLAG